MGVSRYIRAITNQLDWLLVDGTAVSGGFATASGHDLARLGPMVFLWAQFWKNENQGCPWMLTGDWYRCVWVTVGTSMKAPFSLEVGLFWLKVYKKCAEIEHLADTLNAPQIGRMLWYFRQSRGVIRDGYFIPAIDSDEVLQGDGVFV